MGFDNCFGCGKYNPYGLKLTFENKDGVLFAEFIPQPQHGGWPEIVHGGIVSTVLDEAIGWAAHDNGLGVVTGKMEVRFHRQLRVGERTVVSGWLTEQRGRRVKAEARLVHENGTLVAEAKALLLRLSEAEAIELARQADMEQPLDQRLKADVSSAS